MTANSASHNSGHNAAAPLSSISRSRRPSWSGGIFFAHIHSHAQVWHVSYIQRRTICYLVDESLALRISAVLAGAERMVPVATRERFMGGKGVQPTR
jgi:hypothetical protein